MLRALVIGGSVGGLLAANLLRTIGWDATVFERAEGDLGDRGTGIGTRQELFDVLAQAGVRRDASIGADVRSRLCLDRAGKIVHEVPIRAVTSAWARIYRPLKTTLPAQNYHAGALLKPSSRTRTASRRSLPTGRAGVATCWSAPTGSIPRCASSSCPRCSRITPAMWPGAALPLRARSRRSLPPRCSIT